MKARPSAAFLRLICLLLVSIGLIGLTPWQLLSFSCLVLIWLIAAQGQQIRLVAMRIWRMRWFFLAIGLLYGIGQVSAEPWDSWVQAAYRVGVLVTLVTVVTICLDDIPAAHLASALQQLLQPAEYLGLPVAAFSRRLALSLQTVQLMDAEIKRLHNNGHRQALDGIARLCLDAETQLVPAAQVTRADLARLGDGLMVLVLAGGLLLIRSLI